MTQARTKNRPVSSLTALVVVMIALLTSPTMAHPGSAIAVDR